MNNINKPKNYISIDYLKLVLSILVIIIHIPPNVMIDKNVCFWIIQGICRLAVPVFFICSGFFLANKIKNREAFFAYLGRLTKLYLIYLLLYMPRIISYIMDQKESLLMDVLLFITGLFTDSFGFQLWYFVALITSALFLYYILNYTKITNRQIFVITLGLFVTGTCISAYSSVLETVPVIGDISRLYLKIFATTRNGLLFGSFFVFIGYCLNAYEVNMTTKKSLIYFFISIILLNLEIFLNMPTSLENPWPDMYFMLPFASTSLFLLVYSISIPERFSRLSLYARKMSTLVFCWHFVFSYIFQMIVKQYTTSQVGGIVFVLFVSITTMTLSALIIKLSEKKYFKFLENLC